MKLWKRLGVLACAGMLQLVAGCATSGAPAGMEEDGELAREGGRGHELYLRHCAICHGPSGRGDGPPAPVLFPPARDFSSGQFRLVSTENGVPSDEDLLETLRRGMPGSSMPAFDWMGERNLTLLVREVRELAIEGLTRGALEQSGARANKSQVAKAREAAVQRMRAGAPLSVEPPPADPTAALARGRALYREHCASCHGEDGHGLPEEPTWSADGSLRWARDFTSGLLKGPRSYEAMAHRILAGLPGSAMPGIRFAQEGDLAALTTYVLSLIPEAATEALLLSRGNLRSKRVTGKVPHSPDDPRWLSAAPLSVNLTPLWWADASVLHLVVRALHNGEELALRLRWEDASQDPGDPALGRPGDAAAVQWSAEEVPALFGMGAHEHPTDIWHWRASSSAPVLEGLEPHRIHLGELAELLGEGIADVGGAPRPPGEVAAEGIRAEGVEAVGERGVQRLDIGASARWVDGGWNLVLTRRLGASGEGEIDLSPPVAVQVAFAIWNASAGDEGGRKSISIWQELLLD